MGREIGLAKNLPTELQGLIVSLNKKKWMFDLTALQKGDVLLTRSKFIGDGIATATKGQFGHVMLYLESTIIHADTKGVWSKNPQRILMNDQSRLAAYRLKKPLSNPELHTIESYARSRVGSLYSIPQAAKSLQNLPTNTKGRFSLDRQFCSRLVAQSFQQCGISLVANYDYCTPNEIAESALLEEVPHAVVPASDADIAFYKTRDFNIEIQLETYRWLKQVRDLTERHQLRPVYAQSDVGQWILDHPQFDTVICDFIRNTKYLALNDADKRKNPWRYHPQLMINELKSCSSPEEALAAERYQSALNYNRIYNERLKAIHNAQSGLGYFKLEEQLLTMRLAQMVMWKDAVAYASEVIVGEKSADDDATRF
ncbi:YiiX/YebB-like N1pC/P60 family cysteine hydrolase [Burkholderia anthina]|uniref:YiiX/YebB-like N1pC/P60 family cysteine hydrolase n=1 Tax=Burkholderia anthina TaxID=179879 RepID=UPI00158DEBAA|nr:YiiX/YebB-like N1pC/P60 family cysteine hydrolase [Burkholderia anthina]